MSAPNTVVGNRNSAEVYQQYEFEYSTKTHANASPPDNLVGDWTPGDPNVLYQDVWRHMQDPQEVLIAILSGYFYIDANNNYWRALRPKFTTPIT